MALMNETMRARVSLLVPLTDFTDSEVSLFRNIVGNLEHFGKNYVLEYESKWMHSGAYGLTSERVENLTARLNLKRELSVLDREALVTLNSLALYSLTYANKYSDAMKFEPKELTELRQKLYEKMGYSEENAKQMITAGY